MAKERILVVEDEPDILELIDVNLRRNGFEVLSAETGEDGLERARREKPDLVLLDLMLPGLDGLEVCRELRGDVRTSTIPVVMVTARGEEADVVAGLELGADDYITKPFSPRVLVARTKAVLRRRAKGKIDADPGAEDVVERDGLVIHPGRHEARYGDQKLDLTHTEFRLLETLARRPGWVFTRYQIVDAVHGDDYPVTERSVDVQIVGLRRKLGEGADLIETVRGVGYRFRDEEEESS